MSLLLEAFSVGALAEGRALSIAASCTQGDYVMWEETFACARRGGVWATERELRFRLPSATSALFAAVAGAAPWEFHLSLSCAGDEVTPGPALGTVTLPSRVIEACNAGAVIREEWVSPSGAPFGSVSFTVLRDEAAASTPRGRGGDAPSRDARVLMMGHGSAATAAATASAPVAASPSTAGKQPQSSRRRSSIASASNLLRNSVVIAPGRGPSSPDAPAAIAAVAEGDATQEEDEEEEEEAVKGSITLHLDSLTGLTRVTAPLRLTASLVDPSDVIINTTSITITRSGEEWVIAPTASALSVCYRGVNDPSGWTLRLEAGPAAKPASRAQGVLDASEMIGRVI
ncbi:MAG: hypothetical protein P4L40_08760, partial [Terracidiphilus sp.]|nr:hypothetical protein [Terracidiphilus sp.]